MKMNRLLFKALSATAGVGFVASASAQPPFETVPPCFDPMNMMPISNPYTFIRVGEPTNGDVMGCVMGVGGTVTMGGAMGPCFNPAITVGNVGKFTFSDFAGSVQPSPTGFRSAGLALNWGAWQFPVWTYAATSEDGTRTRFGSNPFNLFFTGFSNRYMRAESTNGNVFTSLQVESVADAIRMRWRLTNTDTAAAHNIGLYFGGCISIANFGGGGGFDWAHFLGNKPPAQGQNWGGYIYLPKHKPVITEVTYDRTVDPAGFPEYVDIVYGQSDYYGIRLENEPSRATDDIDINEPTTCDQFWLGAAVFLLGTMTNDGAAFPLVQIPDTEFKDSTAFVQRFPEEVVQPEATRTVLHYIRTTWGESDYKLPFGVAVDAPKTIGIPPNAGGNISPNPFDVRVHVDNVGGYGFDGKEFPLNDCRITLKFPANAGITVVGSVGNTPHQREQTIPVVGIRQHRFIDFRGTIGPDVSGPVPYTVEVFTQPGNVRKEIRGFLNVAARPRVELFLDANMVSLPYNFTDNSLETIFAPWLDPNIPGGDLQFYSWDPIQKGYVIAATAPKGKAFWAIYNKSGSSSVIANYLGNPSQPNVSDFPPLIQTFGGFNMLGNPHNYRMPIALITGVSASAPQVSHPFQEMVELGWVQSFVSTWDPVAKDYVFIAAADGVMEPHKGYWINVLTTDDLTIFYPENFEPFVPNSTRKPIRQSENEWLLKLSGRMQDANDANNAIAQVRTAKDVNWERAEEPPMSPAQQISISIEESGKQMARAARTGTGRQEWKVRVVTKKAGDVTITWPNISQLPKNVRFTIKDDATNVSRQLRQTSGYTFRMDKAGTRELIIVSEPGGSTAAVIGNVVVGGNTRVANGNVSVTYTLGSDATTSVRILSAAGQEVYVISRGRADRAGEQTVTWNLRNSANQAVAPGAYRVEILAENGTGERVRRMVPVNVVR